MHNKVNLLPVMAMRQRVSVVCCAWSMSSSIWTTPCVWCTPCMACCLLKKRQNEEIYIFFLIFETPKDFQTSDLIPMMDLPKHIHEQLVLPSRHLPMELQPKVHPKHRAKHPQRQLASIRLHCKRPMPIWLQQQWTEKKYTTKLSTFCHRFDSLVGIQFGYFFDFWNLFLILTINI